MSRNSLERVLAIPVESATSTCVDALRFIARCCRTKYPLTKFACPPMIEDEQQYYGPKLNRLIQIRKIDSLADLVLPIFPVAPLPATLTSGLAHAKEPVSAYATLLAQVSPGLKQAVATLLGPAPWIVRSSGVEDMAEHINAGGYESLICRAPEDLMRCIAAVALSGLREHARRQQALSGRTNHSDAVVACFVQPLLNIDVTDDVGFDHSPLVDTAVLDRIEGACAVLMETFGFAAIDCEWGLETSLGFVSVTTIMPRDPRLMHVAHTIGFGFASAQNAGSRATTLALRPALTDLRLWRGRHFRETPVRRLHLLQARPAHADPAFRERTALTDDCYDALSRTYEVVHGGLLIPGAQYYGCALVAPDLAAAWRRYLALDAHERAAIAVVIVDEGSAEEHAGIMFRQQKVTCVRMDTRQAPPGADCVAFDRGKCIFGDSTMLQSIRTEFRREMVLPDDCGLVFTDEVLTNTGELRKDCAEALSQLRRLPLAREVREQLLAHSEQPVATRWMQRITGAVESPSLLARIWKSRRSNYAGGLCARTEFARAYERAVQLAGAEPWRVLPTLFGLSSAIRPIIESSDLRLAMALLECNLAASWVPHGTLCSLLDATARYLAAGQNDNAVRVLNSVSLVRMECSRLPVYETEDEISYLNTLACAFENGISPASVAVIHSLGLPIQSIVLLTQQIRHHPAAIERIDALCQALAAFRGIICAGDAAETLGRQLNEAYLNLACAPSKLAIEGVCEQIRGSLIEIYDASLKGLLTRAVDVPGPSTYRRYIGVMQQWLSFLRMGQLSSRDDVVFRRFETWLSQWKDEEIPKSFELEDRNWRFEFASVATAGDAAPRYENPHVLHNLLHQWSLAGLCLDTTQMPRRVQALERFCSTFSSRSTKVLRFERELLEIQIPMGTHKASYVFAPLYIAVEWTEPPDCPGNEIARLLAFEIFLDRLRTWMFPQLMVRREQVLGTWTLFVRCAAPRPGPWDYEGLTLFVAATRFLFDAAYDFSYVKNDAIVGFPERFKGPAWESVVTALIRYRAAFDDASQYVALHTSPMSSAVSAIARDRIVRGMILRCLRRRFDYCWDLINCYADWLQRCTLGYSRWRNRYEQIRQASLLLAAMWPREALSRLAKQESFHVGQDLIAVSLFKRSDLRDELLQLMAAGDSALSGPAALITRHAPDVAVAGCGVQALAMQLSDTGVRFRRAKHYLIAHFGDRIDPAIRERLFEGMDTVPWGLTPAAERAIESQIATRGATCRFQLERGVDWTTLDSR